MNAKMNDLATALTAAGCLNVKVQGDIVFVQGWGIHCSITGNVQARSLFDSADRFGLGTIQTPADALAANFAAILV
jgi:hypothetical protein